MKLITVVCLLLCFSVTKTYSQKIDSIYFHLYTDSLKKGVYNYINVDGLLANGRYLPLDTTQIRFSSSDGTWIGNNLILAPTFEKDFITVTAQLKSKPELEKTVTIYMKKRPDDERLKTEEEIIKDIKNESRRKRKN